MFRFLEDIKMLFSLIEKQRTTIKEAYARLETLEYKMIEHNKYIDDLSKRVSALEGKCKKAKT